MYERTTGLILSLFPLTETSLVVHWLSPDMGRIGTVAKGARRPKSAFPVSYTHLTLPTNHDV